MSVHSRFKGSLEVETVHYLIFAITTFFVFIGLSVDIITEQKLMLWVVFLVNSFVLFILGFFAKYAPKIIVVMAHLFSSFFALLITKNLYLLENQVMVAQIITLIIYVITILSFYVFTFKSLSSGEIVDLKITQHALNKMSIYSKLRRRLSRRVSTRSKHSTKIRSGAYRS
ncbi:MAG: hypothetical protein AB8B80_15870 [Marinicellaceae bacterium]